MKTLQLTSGSTWRRFRGAVYSLFLLFFILSINSVEARDRTVSLMTYNVENLFDAHDDGIWQGDPTFLPKEIKRGWDQLAEDEHPCRSKSKFRRFLCETLDWSQGKYEARLKKVAKVLLGYNGGADIIVLQELENKRVIRDLWYNHLRWRGYRFPIHFESPSSRGIDVGIISRFPTSEAPKAHNVDLSDLDPRPTRYVVEATFKVSAYQQLRVAANHWPSQAHTVYTRRRAASVVEKIAVKSRDEGIPFVALGDFNTLPNKEPNAIANNIADNNIYSNARPLVDLQSYLGGYPNFFGDGSHFYNGEWSPLDRMLVSKDLFNNGSHMRVSLRSFGVYAPSYLLTSKYVEDEETGETHMEVFPNRYDFLTGEGYSDHMPVVLKLLL
jgi:endonuclease/exonuclease/phosphatase family metal-dependent hydrolase